MYLSQLVTNPQKDVSLTFLISRHALRQDSFLQMYKKTLKQILNNDISVGSMADTSALQSAVSDRLSDYTAASKSRIPAVIAMPDTRPSFDSSQPDSNSAIRKTAEALFSGSSKAVPVQQSIGPEFLRLAPPLFCADELVWLDPVGEADYVIAYDTTVCMPRGAGSEARRLISQAFTGSLTLLQQNRLLSELERDSRLVYHVGITPNKVLKPILVLNHLIY